MAWLPITFPTNSFTYTDAQGNRTEVKGLQGIAHKKKVQADITGTVTPEKVRRAMEDYQAVLRAYGVETSYNQPDGVYEIEILPYIPLVKGVRESFANPDTGIAPGILNIDPEKVDDYYGACGERIASLMKQEQKEHPAAQRTAIDLYSQVKSPINFTPDTARKPWNIKVSSPF